MSELTVLLPTLNEEKAIGNVIKEIKELPLDCEILIVDGLSRDGTIDIALSMSVTVVLEHRKGKGIAVRTALHSIDTPYTIMMDGDGTYPVGEIPVFYNYLKRYDVVKGRRTWDCKEVMTKTHHFGNWALSLLASVLCGKRTRDVCSGMWGFRTDKLKRFTLTGGGFTLEADLFINTVKTGCSFKETPITYTKRINGDKAKLMLLDGIKIGWFLLKNSR